jgi:uncharacterized membrane protein
MKRIKVGLSILFAMSFYAIAALAQSTGIYAVKDVAADDSLNVRTGPGAKFQDVGDIAPDGRVRVIGFSDDGKWAEIPWAEDTAWVSARFLKLMHADGAPQGFGLPETMQCGGTEPFWSADVTDETIDFQMMDEPLITGQIEWQAPARGRPADYIVGVAAGPFTAVFGKEICSDGMSDNDYPWSLVLINRSGEGPHVVEGCCR